MNIRAGGFWDSTDPTHYRIRVRDDDLTEGQRDLLANATNATVEYRPGGSWVLIPSVLGQDEGSWYLDLTLPDGLHGTNVTMRVSLGTGYQQWVWSF